MEMEATRRSTMDRSREPGTKKPRLAEETDRGRESSAEFISDRSRARPAIGSGLGNSRIRASERDDREDLVRGGVSHQNQQELVAQYRTALTELIFNSKVIITNLTIIAGENLDVAQSIADVVCDNVLKVPIEQKLPSLYLLDSIVKNIGKDYINHFAARLPQVFCKAYKQVDPSIHHSLRHLFGTWKVVFPPSCLQLIEDELGFQSMRNGSSAGSTGARPDSQAQRPSHSIHVNPKYLEARQQLQQSTKGKEICNEDSERFVRAPSKQWPELSNKASNAQLSQREPPTDFIMERKSYKGFRDRTKELEDQGTNLDQINESDELNKPYYEGDVASQSAAYRRNGFDTNHAYGAYKSFGSTQNDSQVSSTLLNRKSWPVPKNWKASEEEEYIWDDTGSRVGDYERANNARSMSSDANLKSRNWLSMETEQIDSRSTKFDVFQPQSKITGTEDQFSFPRDHEDHYSQHNSQEIEQRINKTAWPLPLRDNPLPSLGLDHTISRLSGQSDRRPTSHGFMPSNDGSVMPRSSVQPTHTSSLGSSIDALGSGGVFGQQRLLSLRSSSPTLSSTTPSSPLQEKAHYALSDQDYIPAHSPQLGQTFSQIADQFSQKIHTSSNSQPSSFSRPTLLSSPSSSYPDLKGHLSSPPTALNEISAPLPHTFRTNESKSSTSNLLAAILKADVLPKRQSDDLVHPPLPNGPPPTQALTSPESLPPISTDLMSLTPLLRGMLPPLPPGPPPTSLQTTNSASIDLNPLSSLLSSLVAKGLITSASTPVPITTSKQLSKESSSQNSDPDGSTSAPPPSNEFPVSEHSSSATGLHNLIGTQFKTEIIRNFHSSVIDSLIDELEHQCPSCGLRFKHQENLLSHLDWHNSTKSGIDNVEKVYRRWYPSIKDWVSGNVDPSCGLESVISSASAPLEDDMEPMVTADESQSICGLCGDPFEDFYSIERDEWMYKGTLYLNSMDENGPIVHAKCFLAPSVDGDDAMYS